MVTTEGLFIAIDVTNIPNLITIHKNHQTIDFFMILAAIIMQETNHSSTLLSQYIILFISNKANTSMFIKKQYML